MAREIIVTAKWLMTAAWLLGFLAACPAFMTICGYVTGREWLQRWTEAGTTPMALNTAVCLFLAGVGMMAGFQGVLRLMARNGHG